ncbi:CLUMA_CG001573, isoform A [Clunio marinus]|uniref:CLUMA_CG001573, isoform A n=1 Tax=Clunio marinus TaxID=568069 RepID=A0A1J1HIG0_9DIPT|nr:CLUMA_CG001573, isoform A [Clunio marinus]
MARRIARPMPKTTPDFLTSRHSTTKISTSTVDFKVNILPSNLSNSQHANESTSFVTGEWHASDTWKFKLSSQRKLNYSEIAEKNLYKRKH